MILWRFDSFSLHHFSQSKITFVTLVAVAVLSHRLVINLPNPFTYYYYFSIIIFHHQFIFVILFLKVG